MSATALYVTWTYCLLRISCTDIELHFGVVSLEDVMRQKTNVTLHGCYEECHRYPELCSGIAFSQRFSLCVMYTFSDRLAVLSDDKGFVYSNASWWTRAHQQKCNGVYCEPGEACHVISGALMCKTLACYETVPEVPYSTLAGNLVEIGTRLSHVCNGISVENSTGPSAACLANGTWSNTGPACLPFGSLIDQGFINGSRQGDQAVFLQSRTECVRQCFENTEICTAVEYSRLNDSCTISGVNIQTHPDKLAPRIGSEIIYKIFPVVLKKHESGESYMIPRSNATEVCKMYGTVIATHSDLEDAYKMGFSMCSCGYVKDAPLALIVMNVLMQKCGEVGIRTCDWLRKGLGDVFCKNPLFAHT